MAFADSGYEGSIVGTIPFEITLAATCRTGDAIGYSSGWKLALATVGTAIPLRCVAAESGITGEVITGFFGPTMITGRITGATVGGSVYVAEGATGGLYTGTAPSTTGDVNVIVGKALSATDILILPMYRADSTA